MTMKEFEQMAYDELVERVEKQLAFMRRLDRPWPKDHKFTIRLLTEAERLK